MGPNNNNTARAPLWSHPTPPPPLRRAGDAARTQIASCGRWFEPLHRSRMFWLTLSGEWVSGYSRRTQPVSTRRQFLALISLKPRAPAAHEEETLNANYDAISSLSLSAPLLKQLCISFISHCCDGRWVVLHQNVRACPRGRRKLFWWSVSALWIGISSLYGFENWVFRI